MHIIVSVVQESWAVSCALVDDGVVRVVCLHDGVLVPSKEEQLFVGELS